MSASRRPRPEGVTPPRAAAQRQRRLDVEVARDEATVREAAGDEDEAAVNSFVPPSGLGVTIRRGPRGYAETMAVSWGGAVVR